MGSSRSHAIPHATPSGYSAHGCRCQPCTRAQGRYRKARDLRVLNGQWAPFAPIDPVRDHIITLRARGVSERRLADLAHVSTHTIGNVLNRRRTRISTRAAKAILAITHDPSPPPHAKVPAWGTVRRCRALAALGWTSVDVAEAAGLTRSAIKSYLRGRPTRVLAANAVGVTDAYRRLGHRTAPPSRTRDQTREGAAARGWSPPAGWDEGWLELSPEELEAELERSVALMDTSDLYRCYAAERAGERSPLVVAGAAGYRRVKMERKRAERQRKAAA